MSKAEERSRAIAQVAPRIYESAPVNAGAWWLGFNEARKGLPYRPPYQLVTDNIEYRNGYNRGIPS